MYFMMENPYFVHVLFFYFMHMYVCNAQSHIYTHKHKDTLFYKQKQ